MLEPLIAHWRERPPRTWSVVVTIFGDAILPRGGTVWLATLTELLAGLGIDAGAVRTAMSRLAADGWTERTRVGRNSAYRLADRGHTIFAAAASRIYAGALPDWDGRLQLVVDPHDRDALADSGFGQVSQGLWMRPGGEPPAEPLTLHAMTSAGSARVLAARAWPLDRIAAAYARFTTTFGALHNAQPAPLPAMLARTLLIHEYRRIVLQHPPLPAALLPPDWPGLAALQVCATAYRTLLPASEAWLTMQDLPPADPALHSRFRQHVTEFP